MARYSHINDVIDNLPDEIADAQYVIDRSQAKIAEGEAEAGRILAEARSMRQCWPSTARWSEWPSSRPTSCSRRPRRTAELRRETDQFIDQRMASFESVLHKTASQVKTAGPGADAWLSAAASTAPGWPKSDERAYAE